METKQEKKVFSDEFSAAWWFGVELAGYRFFGDGTEESFRAATNKEQMRPNFPKIADVLGDCGKTYAEELFLVMMCGFYNDTATDEHLAPKLNRPPTVGRAAYVLDQPRREVIAALLMTYRGW